MDADPGERAFTAALECMGRGDVAGLEALLDAHPELVRARASGVARPYDGYFHRATLLHHVSGNPAVAPLPREAPALARCLLARGAEIDAATVGGPSQPNDVGWTTLGLAATSGAARAVGVQAELIELLLERGADVDARGGIALVGALYYGELAAAEQLAAHGARVDLVAAAGLGDVARIEALVAPDGSLREGAHALVHYGLEPWPQDAGDAEVLAVALCVAARCGRVDALRRLVELGADVDAHPPFDHGATALHWCVIGDQPEALAALLELGADREACDRTYGTTPRRWSEVLGRARLTPLLG